MSKESRKTNKGGFLVKETMLQSVTAIREYIEDEGSTDMDAAIAWVSFLKVNAENNPEFTMNDFDNYVDEIEEAVFNIEDPKSRMSLIFQYQGLGLLMKQRHSMSTPKQVTQTGVPMGLVPKKK